MRVLSRVQQLALMATTICAWTLPAQTWQSTLWRWPASETTESLTTALESRGHRVYEAVLGRVSEPAVRLLGELAEPCATEADKPDYRIIFYSGPIVFAKGRLFLARTSLEWNRAPLSLVTESADRLTSILEQSTCSNRRWLIVFEGTECTALDSFRVSRIGEGKSVASVAYCRDLGEASWANLKHELEATSPTLNGWLGRLRGHGSGEVRLPIVETLPAKSAWGLSTALGFSASGGTVGIYRGKNTGVVLEFAFVPPQRIGDPRDTGFWYQTTEVPVQAYKALTPPRIRERLVACDKARPEECPAVLVTLGDAQAFCKQLGGRLPTLAEWRKAAAYSGQQQIAGCANLDGWIGEDQFDGLTAVGWNPSTSCGTRKRTWKHLFGNASELTDNSDDPSRVLVTGGSFATSPKLGPFNENSEISYVFSIALGQPAQQKEVREDVSFRCVIDPSQAANLLSFPEDGSERKRLK